MQSQGEKKKNTTTPRRSHLPSLGHFNLEDANSTCT